MILSLCSDSGKSEVLQHWLNLLMVNRYCVRVWMWRVRKSHLICLLGIARKTFWSSLLRIILQRRESLNSKPTILIWIRCIECISVHQRSQIKQEVSSYQRNHHLGIWIILECICHLISQLGIEHLNITLLIKKSQILKVLLFKINFNLMTKFLKILQVSITTNQKWHFKR